MDGMETIVYTVAFHGGTEVVEKPEIRNSPRNLDFGGSAMSEKRFAAILFLLVTDLIKRLVANGENAREAIRAFYRSRLYELLGNRETGLWHASTDMLLDLYEGERRTGTVNLDWCI